MAGLNRRNETCGLCLRLQRPCGRCKGSNPAAAEAGRTATTGAADAAAADIGGVDAGRVPAAVRKRNKLRDGGNVTTGLNRKDQKKWDSIAGGSHTAAVKDRDGSTRTVELDTAMVFNEDASDGHVTSDGFYRTFTGVNYDPDRPTSQDAKIARQILGVMSKAETGPLADVAQVKVRTRGHNAVNVELWMHDEPRPDLDDPDVEDNPYCGAARVGTDETTRRGRYRYLTEGASEARQTAEVLLGSMNRYRSDSGTDYRQSKFYTSVSVYGPDGPSWRK